MSRTPRPHPPMFSLRLQTRDMQSFKTTTISNPPSLVTCKEFPLTSNFTCGMKFNNFFKCITSINCIMFICNYQHHVFYIYRHSQWIKIFDKLNTYVLKPTRKHCTLVHTFEIKKSYCNRRGAMWNDLSDESVFPQS